MIAGHPRELVDVVVRVDHSEEVATASDVVDAGRPEVQERIHETGDRLKDVQTVVDRQLGLLEAVVSGPELMNHVVS